MKTLEQKLAAAEETIKALREQSDARAVVIAQAEKEIERLKAIEQEYRGTPKGKKASELDAAATRGEVKVGMTLDQLKIALGNPVLLSEDDFGSEYRFPGKTEGSLYISYRCRFELGKLVSFQKEFSEVRGRRALLPR